MSPNLSVAKRPWLGHSLVLGPVRLSTMMHPGVSLGPCTLVRPFRSTDMGDVWLARDNRHSGAVCLKVVSPANLENHDYERLRSDVAVLSQRPAPGLPTGVRLLHLPEIQSHGLVWDYVDGTPISQIDFRLLSHEQTFRLLDQILATVATLHDRGVVHRDIKPQNIILRTGWAMDRPGGLVLVGLGVVQSPTVKQPPPKETLAFLAPERLAASTLTSHVTPTEDVFALGVLAWQLLLSMHPSGLTEPTDLSELRRIYNSGRLAIARHKDGSAVDDDAAAVLHRAVAPDPNRRYPNAEVFRTALGAVEPTFYAFRSKAASHPLLPQVNETEQVSSCVRSIVPHGVRHTTRAPRRTLALVLVVSGVLGLILGFLGSVVVVLAYLKLR